MHSRREEPEDLVPEAGSRSQETPSEGLSPCSGGHGACGGRFFRFSLSLFEPKLQVLSEESTSSPVCPHNHFHRLPELHFFGI